MTYAMAFSAKVRKNEQLWHTIDICNMFGPTFGFENHNNFNVRNKITDKNCSPREFYLHTHGIYAPSYTTPNHAHDLLSDRLWAPLF